MGGQGGERGGERGLRGWDKELRRWEKETGGYKEGIVDLRGCIGGVCMNGCVERVH